MVRVGDNINERQFPSQFSSSSIQAQSALYKHGCLVGSVSAVTFLILALQSDLPQLLWSPCLQTMRHTRRRSTNPLNWMKACAWGICPMPAASIKLRKSFRGRHEGPPKTRIPHWLRGRTECGQVGETFCRMRLPCGHRACFHELFKLLALLPLCIHLE